MGGIEYNSVHLAKALAGQAVVSFVLPGPGPLKDRLEREAIPYSVSTRPPFVSTSFTCGQYSIFNPFSTFYNFLIFPWLAIKLAGKFRKNEHEVIVTKGLLANFYGALAARLSGKPCLWDMQEIVSKKKVWGLLSWILNAWAFLFVDKILVSSGAIAAQFWKANEKKTVLIPNGIDTDYYSSDINPLPVRNEWGVKPDEILIVHIARFTYWKGQRDFIKAAGILKDRIPQARFAVVGSPVFENDDYAREVKHLAESLGLSGRLSFPGFRDDLEHVLAAADIFVHSSTEAEGCPITLITAMAMQKGCVVTDVKGNDEIVNEPGKQALMVPADSPGDIADAISRIVASPELFLQIKKGARLRILERYSLKIYARETLRSFRDFC